MLYIGIKYYFLIPKLYLNIRIAAVFKCYGQICAVMPN